MKFGAADEKIAWKWLWGEGLQSLSWNQLMSWWCVRYYGFCKWFYFDLLSVFPYNSLFIFLGWSFWSLYSALNCFVVLFFWASALWSLTLHVLHQLVFVCLTYIISLSSTVLSWKKWKSQFQSCTKTNITFWITFFSGYMFWNHKIRQPYDTIRWRNKTKKLHLMQKNSN
jgi:hypothetical protein